MSVSPVWIQATSVDAVPPPVVVATRDAAIGRMITTALRLDGYGPQRFTDGDEAWQALLAAPFAAVLLDVRIPKLDGLSLCRRVRANELLSSIPIIALLMREDLPLWQAHGRLLRISSLLLMPFHTRELLSAVAESIELGPPII